MSDVAYWYAISAVVLFFKMFANSLYQAYHRIGKQAFKTPEDARFVGRTPLDEELAPVQRAAMAWRNDLENIPIFLALGVAYGWVGASPGAAGWLFMTFTAARILHTIFYLMALQPWRTIAYGVGILCLFGMCWQIVTALMG
ncbi:glutathione S-transferase [Modicisalibacter ilicicola DSM 19980]|uniref:Microsomal glutathione S-transferase 1 n=1 Tax=Modicisalibacter ilicicola DSM 19980 TaxID=1121942 RepID=A0A1M5B407_9GAMM|nr:MAPEG family protein [Halomonas ilicicola]SHF37254.1 glutathione S-transferase [Halomonas ilicicola DSM 19980]